ncbi:hypothetical protein [Streptomyces sp. NPDC048496]|uniref:hypothetical protein n=1 Tax=Streptomyces sp. NPDC048496 TaxID=3365558 RepID=UPI00371D4B99
MGDVPAESSGLASGLMMTGHEIDAALCVAGLTAIAVTSSKPSAAVTGHGHGAHRHRPGRSRRKTWRFPR